jgi:hypothetical protein
VAGKRGFAASILSGVERPSFEPEIEVTAVPASGAVTSLAG